MVNKVILVMGASGTGKDYMVDKLCRETGVQKVISRTTRYPRYHGESTHKFVTKELAEEQWDSAIAKTVYHNNMYYTIEEDLENCIFYIVDPAGVKSMDKKYVSQVVLINCDEDIRAAQMRKRGDSEESIKERLELDRVEFKDAEELADVVVTPKEFYEKFYKNINEFKRGI